MVRMVYFVIGKCIPGPCPVIWFRFDVVRENANCRTNGIDSDSTWGRAGTTPVDDRARQHVQLLGDYGSRLWWGGWTAIKNQPHPHGNESDWIFVQLPCSLLLSSFHILCCAERIIPNKPNFRKKTHRDTVDFFYKIDLTITVKICVYFDGLKLKLSFSNITSNKTEKVAFHRNIIILHSLRKRNQMT